LSYDHTRNKQSTSLLTTSTSLAIDTRSAAVDPGDSDNYFCLADSAVLTHIRPCNPLQIVTVRMPNGANIQSFARAEIATNSLPAVARQVRVFKTDDLTEYSLLLVNKHCQSGLEVLF
jgi:hypothetical protein